MNAQKRSCLTVLCLVALLGQGAAKAAPIFDPDTQPVGYIGMPEVSSNIVTSGTQNLFAIDYSSQDWSGNLHSYPLSSTGAIVALDNWEGGAAGKIDLQNITSGAWNPTGRMIVTMNGGTGIPFTWSSLSATQKDDIDSASAALASSPVLNYLRGDRSNENPDGEKYRARSTVLGDIIHSTPVYWNDGTSQTVFVGANDGMLHAIDAATGSERFAYVPSMLIPKLAELSVDPYIHKYFVDGRMDVRKFGSTTFLVGALGAGGKGLFALDVTNAAAADEADAASKLLWEITPSTTGFANLGYTYGQPVLATLDSTAVAIVGNGYNNTGNGHATLFVINASTGGLIAEIDTGSGSAGTPNGLSSPTVVDVDVDGEVDYAYAGDIDGNLWKFDLAAESATLLHTTSPAQAITMAPGVKSHPLGGFMVAFATGRMFTDTDEADTATHYAYGIWDRPVAYAANDTLLEQTLTEAEYTGVTPSIRVRTASDNEPVWTAGAGNHKGWRTALPIGGERVVGDGAYVTGSVFLFMSTNPTVDPTATPPGENWWMQLNALTGGDNGSIRFDLDGDDAFTLSDQVTVSDVDYSPVGRHMGGGVRSQLTALSASGLDVYQSNYDKNGDPPAPPPVSGERGVSGGHFDFDLYCYAAFCNNWASPSAGRLISGTNPSGLQYFHMHEYDDIYDVTGVNMLNASQSKFNLGTVGATTTTTSSTTKSGRDPKPTTSTTTVTYPSDTTTVITTVTVTTTVSGRGTSRSPYRTTTTTKTTTTTIDAALGFKVLVSNQAYSPAAKISVDGSASVLVTSYLTSSGVTAASLPTYSLSTLDSLQISLPLDAFKSQVWPGGSGDVRAGLHPTSYTCAVRNETTGPNGERRDGALLVQIVRSTITDDDIQLSIAGTPSMGYRLKNSSMGSKLLAEYSMFWHHPNNRCMASSDWTKAPPEDHGESDAVAATPAAGSDDPADGLFKVGDSGTGGTGDTGGTGGTGGTDGTGGTGSTGGGTTGGGVTEGVETGGAVTEGGAISLGGVTTPPEVLGRVNWRELRQ